MIALILIVLFLLPNGALSSLELRGHLPGSLTEMEVLPATFQPLWLIAAIPALFQRPIIRNLNVLNATLLLTGLAIASLAIATVVGTAGPAEGWMPPLAGAAALLPFACLDRETGRRVLVAILITNALTVPAVVLKRISEGGEVLRLNASNLNVNSTGLIFALAFCAVIQGLDADPMTRRQRWFAALCAAVVLLSGSRTAMLLLVTPLLTRAMLCRVSATRAASTAVLILAVALAFSGRIKEGEDFGSSGPPAVLADTPAERLSVLGRYWSLLVGLDVVTETGIWGTNSIEDAIDLFDIRGLHSFAHSTVLMIIIVHGIAGLIYLVVCTRYIWHLDAALALRVGTLVVLVLSGGVITNPKEIALTSLVLLLLFRTHDAEPRLATV